MKYSNFDIIERFAFLLPYGYLAPHALELSIPDDSGFSGAIYTLNTSMSERIDAVQKAHRRRIEALYAMEKAGYIEKVTRKVNNKNAEEITIYRLTRSGFYVLTGTYDEELEKTRIDKSGGVPTRNRNRISFQYANETEKEDLILLNSLAEHSGDAEHFDLADQIFNREFSILASEMVVARNVRITPSTKASQLYRNSRLASVNALFRACNYLTPLDLLPLECILPVVDIHDPANREHLNIEVFTNYTLGAWHEKHRYSLYFSDPHEVENSTDAAIWFGTPVFYPISVIPGFSSFETENEGNYTNIGSNRYHHTAIGFAGGRKANYLVYHTHPCSVDWRPSLQEEMMNMMRRALERCYESCPHPHINKPFEYALMICPTVHQFKALFKNAKARMGKKKGRLRKVARPFDALCIIPLNHAGIYQTKYLMESNPITLDDVLIQVLVKKDQSFQKTNNPLFQLSFNKTPVFVAASMNFQRLFDAMELYEAGQTFYVVCLPEQVPYIRSIMPNVEFL